MNTPGRQVIESELKATLFRLRELATLLDSPDLLKLVPNIEDGMDRLLLNKCGNAKVFVAIHGDSIQIESTAQLDVIVAKLASKSKPLESETLSPMPEQEFLELIHDTMADAIQSGSVNPADINQLLK